MSGATPAVRAVMTALPTSRHAEPLFDLVVERLGEQAHVQSAPGGAVRRLYRREPGEPALLHPWSLVCLRWGARQVFDMEVLGLGLEPAELPPRPERRVPRLSGLKPGELEIRSGGEHIEIVYGENGGWSETCRSSGSDPLGSLAAPAAEPGNAVESLARGIVGLAPPPGSAGRVFLPAPLPIGVESVWHNGLRALRRALFRGPVRPADPRWMVADGFDGTALGTGASRAEALADWRRQVGQHPPAQPRPKPGPPPEPPPEIEGAIVLRSAGPPSDAPWPEPVPHHVPAAVVELPPLPPGSPLGTWICVVGAHGHVRQAVLRHEPDGLTLFGERVLAALDPDTLTAPLDAADQAHAEIMARVERSPHMPRLDSRVAMYRVLDEATGRPVRPVVTQTQEGVGFDPANWDGDALAWCVLRQRWLG